MAAALGLRHRQRTHLDCRQTRRELIVNWHAHVFERVPGVASLRILPLAVQPVRAILFLVHAVGDLGEGRADLVVRVEGNAGARVLPGARFPQRATVVVDHLIGEQER
jgi:hypothetical protein